MLPLVIRQADMKRYGKRKETVVDLKEFAGVNDFCEDLATGKPLNRRKLYARVVDKLGGAHALEPYIPFTIDQLRRAYRVNPYFSTLPIQEWDVASGFHVRLGGWDRLMYAPALDHYASRGLTEVNNPQSVAILKEAACQLVEEADGETFDVEDLL